MFGDFGGDFGDFGDFGGAMGGAMGGAVDGAARRVWGGEGGAPQRRACGDGAAHGRGRAAGARPSRAHRAGRAALAWVAARALYVCRVFPDPCARPDPGVSTILFEDRSTECARHVCGRLSCAC